MLARHPLFEAYQTVDIPFAAERRAIKRLIGDRGRVHTYTLTRVYAELNVSLSALDAGVRQRAIDATVTQFEHAQEAGARVVAVISGPRPADPAKRAEALAGLEDSLAQLAAAITRFPGLELLIEPLDHEAHKRNTLGTTPEAVAICRRLASRQLRLNLCLDTSHLILNGEDTLEAVGQARDFITEFHFCNPVLDRASPIYGDQHPPFGPPGVVGFPEIASLLAGLYRIGYLSTKARPRVYCEVLKSATLDSMPVVAHCQEALLSGWAQARRILTA
ncbi:MAG: sugar phosphate isomerase/epimerase [Opitutaceae bacterium]|nr:sugar phosphate isomerase/epimerase [Opitutaceae bacterium]